MAMRHSDFTAAGAIVVGISVDSPQQNAAMVEKLGLPFPLLADPDRSGAIEPYGVADLRDPREIAIPTTVVVDPDGQEHWRRPSFDFADRPEEDEVLDVVQSLGLAATEQSPPAIVGPQPGSNAVSLRTLAAYYRGAKFAAIAMGRRFPEAKESAKAYAAQMDRYVEAVRHGVGESRSGADGA